MSDFREMVESMNLAYCDMIAYAIKENIGLNTQGFVTGLSVGYDLAEEGYLQTTTKYVECVDGNGKKYKITVEEA